MVSYCVGLTSVYGITVGKFVLLCLQVFIITVIMFKMLFSLYVAILYFSFKHKRQRLLFGF